MNTKEYYRLIANKENIKKKIRKFIVAAIKENGGKIQFTPENGQEFQELSNEDFPIVTTLYGKYDNPNIAITEVNLDVADNIYVNGMNVDSGEIETGFCIFNEHHSEVLQFIALYLGWTDSPVSDKDSNSEIMELASELAEKELMDKYGKYSEELYNGENLKVEYQDEFNDLYDKYFTRLTALTNNEDIEEELEATVIFGEDAVREYNETGHVPSEEWLLNNGGVVDTKHFKSQALYEAYCEGVSDAEGWLDSLILRTEK